MIIPARMPILRSSEVMYGYRITPDGFGVAGTLAAGAGTLAAGAGTLVAAAGLGVSTLTGCCATTEA